MVGVCLWPWQEVVGEEALEGNEWDSKQQVTLLPPVTAQTENVAVSVQSFFYI